MMWSKKTIKNKIVAILLIVCGLVPAFIDKDITAEIMMLLFAIPLFFAKDNWIMM